MCVPANSRSADPAQHLAPLHLQAPPPQRWVARSTRFAKEMSIKRSTMPRRRQGSGLTLGFIRAAPRRSGRSEEHTSELQSLMRISYAVFCLHTKTDPEKIKHTRPQSHVNTITTSLPTYT